jgi:hypothetical protein
MLGVVGIIILLLFLFSNGCRTTEVSVMSEFSKLKAGDIESTLGKKIKELILASDTFIVYMDDNDVIQWSSDKDDVLGDIPNQISYWETISNRLFSREESYDYKCLLAEGYARMLDGEHANIAQKIIDQAVDRITTHGREMLRQQYMLASLFSTVVVGALLILSIIGKNWILGYVSQNAFDVYLAGLFGGVGAFVSTMTRSKKYDPEIAISKKIHTIDGILRIIYGLIVAGLIAIGIKANLVFGFINGVEKNIYVFAFLGAIGGASEVIFPNIIKKIEKKV